MRTWLRLLLATGVCLIALPFGPQAQAACHFFTVGATSSVSEGNQATVIVERDGSVADSSVRVMTKNGTALAGSDYTKFDERVEFTGDETQQSIKIKTTEDSKDENNEAFTVSVSEGEGCEVNQNYDYGDPATITIKDEDAPATTILPGKTPSPTPKPAPTPSPTPTPTASPSPTPTTTPSPSPSPASTPTAIPLIEEEGGFPWLAAAAILGLLAAGGGALILTRMRRGGATPV